MDPSDHVLDGYSDPPWEGAILRGKDMPADLSPLAAANELVRRLRCGGIIAHAERVNSSSRGGDAAFRQITLTTCSTCWQQIMNFKMHSM